MAPSRALYPCTVSVRRLIILRCLTAACRLRSQPSSPTTISRASYTTAVFRVSHQLSTAQTRTFSQAASSPEPPDYLSEGELHVFNKIKAELEPTNLEVQDISGGCGSMYALDIESAKFKGLTVIKQHKLVNQILAEEIKNWHGVQLKTRAA